KFLNGGVRRVQVLQRFDEILERVGGADVLTARKDRDRLSRTAAANRGGLCKRHRVERRWRGTEDFVELGKDRARGGRCTVVEAIEADLERWYRHQFEGERGVDPEAAARSAPACPEQVRVLVCVGSPYLTVGGHDPGFKQAVAGQPGPMGVVADAAAEH